MKNKLLLSIILFCISVEMFAQQQELVTREQVLNMYYKAQKAEKSNKKEEAVEIYKTLLSIDQNLPTPYLRLANIYAADENNLASLKLALPLYRKYLELNPADKNADALKNTVARLEEKLKSENTLADSSLSQALAEPPKPSEIKKDDNPAAVNPPAENSGNLPPGVTEDTDINTLWEKAQTAITENNYGIAGTLLNRIVSLVSPNHPLFAQSNMLLANIYGKAGNTVKMQEAINTLESYVEIHEQVVSEMDNTNRAAKTVTKIPFEDDLCGIWVSGYSEDGGGLPYLVLEIVNKESKYFARILPHCTLAKKHGMYAGHPFQYLLSNMSGQTSAVKYSTGNTIEMRNFLAITDNLEIHGDSNTATLYFGDEELKENKKGFAESAVHTVGMLVDNIVTDIVVAGISFLFSELSASKTTVVTLDMHIKRLFTGCANLVLEQTFYTERSNSKKTDIQQSSKTMKLYRLYPEYSITFASKGNELFGYREFKKEELLNNEDYKSLLKTNARKDFNKQAYKKLAGKVIETSKSSLSSPDSSNLIREIRENFEYATQGFSYQEIVNRNGVYKGWTDISGKSNGYGHAILSSGYEYLGEWKDSKYYGTGKYTVPGMGVYTGGFLNGKFHGNGIFSYLGGEQYEGEWKNGKRNGTGKYSMANGDIYEGIWKNGEAQTGKIKYANGEIYEGPCKYDETAKRIEQLTINN
ncbi:MAG: hypothetical protein LBK58_08880 [Prevotellaceae bacterium]|jgi:hypothetical protein|nr:hypothetical protein [Prevotellaceae bacterium]